jgi:ribosomal protein S18 acetylase RimI-like enzyme
MIRRAEAEDVDAIAELFERSWATLTFLPVLHTVEEHRRYFGRIREEGEVWVYEDGGAILGFGAFWEGMLSHLYLEPDAFGTGIGDALFEHATERRPEGFDFWVFQENARARRFYERHGCRAVEFTDGAHNEEKTPDVRYEWRPATPAEPLRG